MKILYMQASFGKLEKEELRLESGLNILTRPNEAGKTTWGAFLLAMFYGIDTSERDRREWLSVKSRYRPWSGAPMEGRMDLEWNGKKITIERSSTGRVPMGNFRAYETETGHPVPELTADSCGRVLLGAERSVFERSAFVRQSGLAVSADSELEKRLNALVTTGEERVSAQQTDTRLKDLCNRIRFNRTGLLPETEAELEKRDGVLEEIRKCRTEEQDNRAQQVLLEQQAQEKLKTLDALDALEHRKKLEAVRAAEQAVEEAEQALKLARGETERLPAPKQVEEIHDRLRQHRSFRIPEMPGDPPVQPACPAAFEGVTEDRLMKKAEADVHDFDRLTDGKHAPVIAWLFCMLCLLALGAAAFALQMKWQLWAAAGAGTVLFLVLMIAGIRRNRKRNACLDEAQALLQLYENRSKDEFVPFAAQYHETLALWHSQLKHHEELCRAHTQAVAEKAQLESGILGSVRMFRPEADTMDACEQAVEDAALLYARSENASEDLRRARLNLETLRSSAGDLTERPVPEGDWENIDRRQTEQELQRIRFLQEQNLEQRGRIAGRAEAMGDPAELTAQREITAERKRTLEENLKAASMAREVLRQAGDELASRFSPELARQAGSIFSELTGGAYDRVLLDRDFTLHAEETGEPVTRQLLSLSGGTADQLYLALRLAVCRLVLREDTPIVLDDALVMFDDVRMKRALEVLKKEALTRQILLFTCQNREASALSGAEE